MANPANPAPASIDTEWDPLEFWIKHKTKVVLYALLLIAAVLIYGIYEFSQRRTNTAAAEALAHAKSADDYRNLISRYPGTAPAANAHLLLGDLLRNESKWDESTQVLRTFAEKYPEHELISGAYTSIGANQEMAGKNDEALASYQRVTSGYPTAFNAPVAWLAQARIFKAQGKTEEAKRAYETVMAQFPDTVFAQEATRLNGQLKK